MSIIVTSSTNVEVQEAIDSLGVGSYSSGGGLILLVGTFDFAAPLTINAHNIHIRGEGRSTVINKNFNGNLITAGDGSVDFYGFEIDHLRLECNSDSYTGGGLVMTRLMRPNAHHLWIRKSADYGIHLQGYVHAAFGFGGRIDSNDILECGSHGILVDEGMEGFIISKNDLWGNLGDGIRVGGYAGYYQIIDNHIEAPLGGMGIYIMFAARGNVSDNQIIGAGTDGIFINNSSNVIVSGNTIADANWKEGGSDGIIIQDGNKVTVHDNNVFGEYHTVRYGIYNKVVNSCHDVSIQDNIVGNFPNAPIARIKDDGVNNTFIRDNI